MSLCFISGVEGRLAPADASKNRPERFYGKIHVVRGRYAADQLTGHAVGVIDCQDFAMVDSLRKHVPGFFDVDSGVEVQFGEPRERVYGAVYLGGQERYIFSGGKITELPAKPAIAAAANSSAPASQSLRP